MESYLNPPREQWPALCRRPSSVNPTVRARVEAILKRVREQGDEALRALSLEIDGRPLEAIEVGAEEIREAQARVGEPVKRAVAQAEANIRAFHEAQRPQEISVQTAPGVRCIQRPVPIARVGLYIPGGTAPLFSTVLMLAVPAAIAQCPEVVLCTPAGKDGKVNAEVLYTAAYCGVKRIFKLGGAQAVAAMAYGTQTVPQVDKIFGPGNQYVTTAKQLLSADTVAIDMPAGPSEVMVVTDGSVPASFLAADLLSQAEHGADSQVMLVCTDTQTEGRVREELERQTAALPRADYVRQALDKSRCIVLPDAEDRIAFANAYAPEHLILSVQDPWQLAARITAAGSVFVGAWTPESAGDYASGTNHTLPTCGWARSFSGVNLDSFYRKMTLQELSPEGLRALSETIVTMAEAEGLQAHANAVKIRLNDE
ncbi:MAG: histidinol dehydrogenase [Bacteroidales bacterium]|jgi:histidinol dehydrogenase|nr:histidinol dehydrogenase [Bacteroidales bacterium]